MIFKNLCHVKHETSGGRQIQESMLVGQILLHWKHITKISPMGFIRIKNNL